MYAIYANIGGILMVNVTIYSIHGSYGYELPIEASLILSTSATGTSLSATPLGVQAQSGQKPFVIGPAIFFEIGRLRP